LDPRPLASGQNHQEGLIRRKETGAKTLSPVITDERRESNQIGISPARGCQMPLKPRLPATLLFPSSAIDPAAGADPAAKIRKQKVTFITKRQ
jgi:hypothetical protein